MIIDDFVKSAIDILNERIGAAMVRVTGQPDCAAIVRPATDARFGDYQANGAMALAKQLRTNPRKLAEAVVEQLDVGDLCEPPEVAGPGFINLRLKPEYVAGELLRIAEQDGRASAFPRRPLAPDRRRRFLQPERSQADARRSPPQHDHRRLHLPNAGV